MNTLMRNRTFHKDFDAIMAHERTRIYMKDLVFQDSSLRCYKDFVNKDKKYVTEDDLKEYQEKLDNKIFHTLFELEVRKEKSDLLELNKDKTLIDKFTEKIKDEVRDRIHYLDES